MFRRLAHSQHGEVFWPNMDEVCWLITLLLPECIDNTITNQSCSVVIICILSRMSESNTCQLHNVISKCLETHRTCMQRLRTVKTLRTISVYRPTGSGYTKRSSTLLHISQSGLNFCLQYTHHLIGKGKHSLPHSKQGIIKLISTSNAWNSRKQYLRTRVSSQPQSLHSLRNQILWWTKIEPLAAGSPNLTCKAWHRRKLREAVRCEDWNLNSPNTVWYRSGPRWCVDLLVFLSFQHIAVRSNSAQPQARISCHERC